MNEGELGNKTNHRVRQKMSPTPDSLKKEALRYLREERSLLRFENIRLTRELKRTKKLYESACEISEQRRKESAHYKLAVMLTSSEVEQILGKALGYPAYKDDQENFPGATEQDGVCVGEHVPQSLAEEAAKKIFSLKSWVDDLQSGMYINCVYCGYQYGPKDSTPVAMSAVLKEHIEQCPEHPMRKLKIEYVALKERLERIVEEDD
jgi:hypothetical protein